MSKELVSALYKTDDFKTEKHVPAIEVSSLGDGYSQVEVTVGKEDPHPNTLEHQIKSISVYYKAEGNPLPIELGTFNFSAHGESDSFTEPNVKIKVKLSKAGKVYATSYCNIHGLWEESVEV